MLLTGFESYGGRSLNPSEQIVRRLAGGERCVCELTSAMDAAQSRLSFHLRTLKDAGLVTDRKEGRWVYYSLDHEVLDAIADFTASLGESERWSDAGKSCCS